MQPFDWRVDARDELARTGVIETRRSSIETPVFMPVGTLGSVKGLRFEWLEDELGFPIILGNTYHLWIRPGTEVIKELGGLHKFIGWRDAILTDSGGFQVFSLSGLRKIGEEGVEFRSHLDGAKLFMSPEVSMKIQAALGSDIVMAFDECPPGDAGRANIEASLRLTARWAGRSKEEFIKLQEIAPDSGSGPVEHPRDGFGMEISGKQALFGIIQGAGFTDLRKESLERTAEIGFDGYAVGGLSVGEEKPVMYGVLEEIVPLLPESPRYLMGVGTPEDILHAVACGVDMFDCVLPTRNGRTGGAFTSSGDLNIRNARFARDERPLDPACRCSVCMRYSRAYIRHLHNSKEMLAATLISHHNLAFYASLMRGICRSIRAGGFRRFSEDLVLARGSG